MFPDNLFITVNLRIAIAPDILEVYVERTRFASKFIMFSRRKAINT
jgi:hypothetical protein